jgi:hypothetical protein
MEMRLMMVDVWRGAGAARDDGEDDYLCTRSVASEGVGEKGVFISDSLHGVRQVIICVVLTFPYLNISNRGVATSSVRVADE